MKTGVRQFFRGAARCAGASPRAVTTFVATLCFAALALAATAQEKPAGATPAAAEKATALGADDVIYPRHAAPADAPAVPTKSGGGNATLLLLALGVGAAGGWMLWRQRRGVGGANLQARKLSITESRPLGNRQYLVVADYDGKKFLLGVCPGRIEMLTPLEAANASGVVTKKDGDA